MNIWKLLYTMTFKVIGEIIQQGKDNVTVPMHHTHNSLSVWKVWTQLLQNCQSYASDKKNTNKGR